MSEFHSSFTGHQIDYRLNLLAGLTDNVQIQLGRRYTQEEGRGRSSVRLPRGGIYCDGNASTKAAGGPVIFGTGNFTVVFGILLPSYTPGTAATLFTATTDTNPLSILLSTAGAFVVRFNDGSNHDFTLTPDLPLVADTPYEICISVTRSGNAVLYINGLSDRDYNGTGVAVSVAAQSALNLGTGSENTSTFGENLTGIIFSLRAYTRALSAADALRLALTGVVDHADIVSGCILDLDFAWADPVVSATVRDRSSMASVWVFSTAHTSQIMRIPQFNAAILMNPSGTVPSFLTLSSVQDFGSIAAAGSADITVTVNGAAVGDAVALGLGSAPTAGIVFMAFVSATNSVKIRAMNITGGSIDPASQTFRVTVFK